MVKKINLLTTSSKEFLEILRLKILEVAAACTDEENADLQQATRVPSQLHQLTVIKDAGERERKLVQITSKLEGRVKAIIRQKLEDELF